jgi:hypothetical protein
MIPYDELPPDHGHDTRVLILSDAQIETIAQRVEDRFYKRIGKKVVEKVLWAIGLGCLALLAWLGQK